MPEGYSSPKFVLQNGRRSPPTRVNFLMSIGHDIIVCHLIRPGMILNTASSPKLRPYNQALLVSSQRGQLARILCQSTRVVYVT